MIFFVSFLIQHEYDSADEAVVFSQMTDPISRMFWHLAKAFDYADDIVFSPVPFSKSMSQQMMQSSLLKWQIRFLECTGTPQKNLIMWMMFFVSFVLHQECDPADEAAVLAQMTDPIPMFWHPAKLFDYADDIVLCTGTLQ